MTEQVMLPDQTEFMKLLEQAGGGYVEALHKLMAKAQKAIDKKEGRSTIAGRKSIYKKALVEFNDEILLDIQEEMTNFVDALAKDQVVPAEEPRMLNAEERLALMKQYLSYQKISEFADTFRMMTRAMVFADITEQNAKEVDGQGNPVHDHPEHVNGSIVVGELGKKFCKEGTGRKDPSIDEEKLKELLGDKWCEVVDVVEVEEQFIPAHTEVVFSELKLGGLMLREPGVLEDVREALVPGAWKPAKFVVRNA